MFRSAIWSFAVQSLHDQSTLTFSPADLPFCFLENTGAMAAKICIDCNELRSRHNVAVRECTVRGWTNAGFEPKGGRGWCHQPPTHSPPRRRDEALRGCRAVKPTHSQVPSNFRLTRSYDEMRGSKLRKHQDAMEVRRSQTTGPDNQECNGYEARVLSQNGYGLMYHNICLITYVS